MVCIESRRVSMVNEDNQQTLAHPELGFEE
jgi:hypothetical protein